MNDFELSLIYDRLDEAVESGEITEEEAYANKCAKWRYKHRDYIAKIEAEWRDRYERNQDA